MTGSIQQITVISASTFLLNYDNNFNTKFKTKSKTRKTWSRSPKMGSLTIVGFTADCSQRCRDGYYNKSAHAPKSNRGKWCLAGGMAKTLTAAVPPSLSRPDSQSLSPILLTASNIAVPYGAEPAGSTGLQSWGFFFFPFFFFFF